MTRMVLLSCFGKLACRFTLNWKGYRPFPYDLLADLLNGIESAIAKTGVWPSMAFTGRR